MSEWSEYRLGDLVETNRSNIGKDYDFSSILYLDTGSITRGRIDGYQEISLSEAPSRAKRLVSESDIIYSAVRPIQRHYGFITDPPKNLVVSTGFVVITCDERQIYPKFLYYHLSSDESVAFLDTIAEGSTSAYPSLKPSDIESLDIILPDLPEQKAITAVLASLDDKIDLLHRQNKTLESLAQTLFRHWFIDGAEDDWEERPLQKVVDIAIGRTPPRKEFHWFSTDPANIKWVSIKDLGNEGVFIFDTAEYLTPAAVDKFRIPVIPKDTVVLSFKMTVGRVGITSEPMVTNEAIAHFKFNASTPFTKEYLYFFLKLFRYEELGSTSTIVTSINSQMIKQYLRQKIDRRGSVD